jgi:hypothetical protein
MSQEWGTAPECHGSDRRDPRRWSKKKRVSGRGRRRRVLQPARGRSGCLLSSADGCRGGSGGGDDGSQGGGEQGVGARARAAASRAWAGGDIIGAVAGRDTAGAGGAMAGVGAGNDNVGVICISDG